MSPGLVSVVTAIYLVVAFKELKADHVGMAVVFFGYALANVGMIYSMMKGGS